MPAKTMNITMPEELVAELDKVAKKEYRNRSELIREAVRVYVDERTAYNALTPQQVAELEDKIDLQAIRDREGEPTVPFDEVAAKLGLK